MPRYLTASSVAVALFVVAASGRFLTSVLPALVVVGFVAAAHFLWARRGRPWHDPAVIVLLLPAIAGAVWIAIGGLATGIERSEGARLLLEVGPGVALVGLLCTLVSYHGRHHPDEGGQVTR